MNIIKCKKLRNTNTSYEERTIPHFGARNATKLWRNFNKSIFGVFAKFIRIDVASPRTFFAGRVDGDAFRGRE